MSELTTYLITGASRGLGKGLLEELLLRPKVIIVAALRDPSSSGELLHKLGVGEGSKLIVVKIDSISERDAESAIRLLKTELNISKLDVVIANSGIAKHIGSVLDTPISEMRDHFEVNTIGPLTLFQAAWPLLNNASRPKFVVISSHAGSIGDIEHEPFEMLAYGMSKTAVNFLVRRIHLSYPSLIAFPIHPGWVKTDLGNAGAAELGMQEAVVSVHDSVAGILSEITRRLGARHLEPFEPLMVIPSRGRYG